MMMGLIQVNISICQLNSSQVRIFHCSQGVRGIGCIVGPTLVGYLFDWTGTYAIANTAGCITLMCGVGCMIGVTIMHKHHFRKSPYMK